MGGEFGRGGLLFLREGGARGGLKTDGPAPGKKKTCGRKRRFSLR